MRPNNKNTPIVHDYGKVPPQAVDIEEVVLGAILLDKDAMDMILDFISPEIFYKNANQLIFQSMINLYSENKNIDILTLIQNLTQKGNLELVGGYGYIIGLTDRVVSAFSIEQHARIIKEKYIGRELIRTGSEIVTKGFDGESDIADILEYAESEIFKISNGNSKTEPIQINGPVKEALNKIEESQKSEKKMTGIPSGISRLDKVTSGFQIPDLIILAARPSMGKTAVALYMAYESALIQGTKTLLFSLEMSTLQLTNRLLAIATGYSQTEIREGNVDWDVINKGVAKIHDMPIFIDDTAGISLTEVRAKSRRMKMKHDIDLVIIDYLQLMTNRSHGSNSSREQEVSSISRGLKALAKDLGVPVIALSQLNRMLESSGGDKRPNLSHLRESGAIEQDADVVLFVHRPEKYGIMEDDSGNSMVNVAEIIIGKHRNGALDTILTKTNDYKTIWDYETEIKENINDNPVGNNDLDRIPINTNFENEGDNDVPF